MSRLIHLIGSAAVIVFGLTPPAMGSSSIPSVVYEKYSDALLDEAPYISGFECLVHGENIAGKPICDYYKAVASRPLKISRTKTSEEICFKDFTPVSIPREYKAETIYRIIVETKLGERGEFEGVTFARILSLPEDLQEGKTTPWYETRSVALYNCDLPYDGKSALGVEQKTGRLATLSKTYNIPILDNELSELVQLRAEEEELQSEMQIAVVKMIVNGEINPAALGGGEPLSGEMLDKLPNDILMSMSEVRQRIEAIEAPFEAAAKADIIRKDMVKLSKKSGVPISSKEMEETVALNAEKDRIQKRTELAAVIRWRAEGGPVSAFQKPLPNAEDDVRLKEIEARLNTIYAPHDLDRGISK